jgi:hypothetical protein
MSVTSGGTAPNGWITGGSCSASAGSAGISMTLRASTFRRRRSQSQTLALRSAVETTTPTKPYACAGRAPGAAQDHLLLGAEVDRLLVAAALEVPHVQLVAVLAHRAAARLHAVLDHRGVPHSLVSSVS